MDQFYVTLPSNSSFDFYGKQPMSNYKTRLAKSLQLDVTEWEVGLAEFIYPITWNNVKDATFDYRKLDGGVWKEVDCAVPDGRYHSCQHLTDTLQKELGDCLEEQSDKIQVGYLDLERKTKVYLAENYRLDLSQPLSEALGFGDTKRTRLCNYGNGRYELRDETTYIDGETIISPYVADVDRSLRTLYIHCDVVQPQLVGDMYVPLLRTVAVKGTTGQVVAEKFNNIHYMSIERSTFQEIEIHITDDTGKNIPFEQGRVIVKLHFRRRS
jgi:hypothetical protein